MKVTDKYVFFYEEWLSNFYHCNLKLTINSEEHKFHCSEQAFMYLKAIYFGDKDTASMIEKASTPLEAKHLGRQVKNYNDDMWNKVRKSKMIEVNEAKYTQNPNLLKQLLDKRFDNKMFVEASPRDVIWGIGLDEHSPLINDKKNWRGQNLLGKVLTYVRNKLKKQHDIKSSTDNLLEAINVSFK